MRLRKIKLLEGITTWSASFGIAAVVMGGAGCLGGLGSVITIKLAESLLPHRPTIQKVLFYGSATAGTGLFLIGVANGLAVIGERLCDEEARRIYCEMESAKLKSKYAKCFQCKYYDTEELLPCALHPTLKEDCNDWEADQ